MSGRRAQCPNTISVHTRIHLRNQNATAALPKVTTRKMIICLTENWALPEKMKPPSRGSILQTTITERWLFLESSCKAGSRGRKL